ncbi:hypothetical protein Bca4012_028105 [Brassica carinata]|uniref:Uncharacterized protein n=1 Tax=Brassica carinata TaxID=52824 RepID=A0A8X8AWF5_BRACI|nr:hypothetical protein Bca52824_025124 [Brassica carinata]
MRERVSSLRDPTITTDTAGEKEGETRGEIEELRRKLAMEKKRMNRIKLCSSMELIFLFNIHNLTPPINKSES